MTDLQCPNCDFWLRSPWPVGEPCPECRITVLRPYDAAHPWTRPWPRNPASYVVGGLLSAVVGFALLLVPPLWFGALWLEHGSRGPSWVPAFLCVGAVGGPILAAAFIPLALYHLSQRDLCLDSEHLWYRTRIGPWPLAWSCHRLDTIGYMELVPPGMTKRSEPTSKADRIAELFPDTPKGAMDDHPTDHFRLAIRRRGQKSHNSDLALRIGDAEQAHAMAKELEGAAGVQVIGRDDGRGEASGGWP